MKRLTALAFGALFAFAVGAQVTTNPGVTGAPQPSSAVKITGGTITGVTISGSTINNNITGNATTVTNFTGTTALTNNGGAGTLTWPAGGATLTIPTGGGTLGNSAFATIGSGVQAYNSNLTGIDQALSSSSSPTFAVVTATTGVQGLKIAPATGTDPAHMAFVNTGGTYRVGADNFNGGYFNGTVGNYGMAVDRPNNITFGITRAGTTLDIGISGSGVVTITNLAGTGSATGKTIVCADTNGTLYRSSSGVACAN